MGIAAIRRPTASSIADAIAAVGMTPASPAPLIPRGSEATGSPGGRCRCRAPRRRHQEVHERGVLQLPVLVVGHPLVQRPAHALRDAAVHLPSTIIGFTTLPQSCTTAYFTTSISHVVGSISTIAACAPDANVDRIGE